METKLPKGLISPDKAKELNQRFVKTRSKALDQIVEDLDKKPKKKDAISSWFSLDELKDYIAYVETQGKEKNITVNGLRVYFGAYSESDKKTSKKSLSTVFFVPTQPKVGSMQKDGGDGDEGGSDIEDVDGLNDGQVGSPPSSGYPQ